MPRAYSSLALPLLIVLSGCASSSLTKVDDTKTLPPELTQDLRQKFEVKESTEPPEASPKASLAAGTLKKNKKAQAKVLKKKNAVPTVFTFPNRRPPRIPIRIGEKQVYEITYFGMAAGDFTLEVPGYKEINNRKVYQIRGLAESSKVFSLFYRLRDTIESFLDYEGLFSHRFHIVLDESKQTRNSLELYDPEKARAFYWNRWNHPSGRYIEIKDFFPMMPFSQDSLSALYYIRSQPLKDGDVVVFPVASEGNTWEAVVTVERREVLDTKLGKVPTIKLRPETKYQGVLKKQGDSFIWITDDDRRLLVRLEAKVKIGTVVARIKRAEPGTDAE